MGIDCAIALAQRQEVIFGAPMATISDMNIFKIDTSTFRLKKFKQVFFTIIYRRSLTLPKPCQQ